LKIFKAGSRPQRKASSDWFHGNVMQDPIIDAEDPARVRTIKVSFEPKARTAWHTHPLGQTLFVLSGVGLIGLRHEAPKIIKAGDSVWIPESRNPQSLYKAYSGSRDELIQASYEHALTDLYHLKINFVENEKQFNSVMRSLLIQEPIFKLINDFIEEPKRFGAVTKYLKGTLKQDLTREQIDYIWQIILILI